MEWKRTHFDVIDEEGEVLISKWSIDDIGSYRKLRGKKKRNLLKVVYGKHPNFLDFAKFLLKCYEEDKFISYFEFYNENVKFFFDVDCYLKLTLEDMKLFVRAFDQIVKKLFKKYKILVYNSTSEEKFSFHILLHGVYFKKNETLRKFKDYVFSKMDDSLKIKEFCDDNVYIKNRMLRTIFSSKPDCKRHRLLFDIEKEAYIKDYTLNDVIESFVTYVKGCDFVDF